MILQPSLFDSRKKHKVSALVLMSHREITEFSLKLVVWVCVCVGGLGGGVGGENINYLNSIEPCLVGSNREVLCFKVWSKSGRNMSCVYLYVPMSIDVNLFRTRFKTASKEAATLQTENTVWCSLRMEIVSKWKFGRIKSRLSAFENFFTDIKIIGSSSSKYLSTLLFW